MKEQKEKYKIIVMAILVGICCVLTYYFHMVVSTGVVFTHFFYIPIILAAVWWKRKGLVVALFLTIMLIFSHFTIRADVITTNDLIRAPMFIVVALVTVFLCERIAKAQEEAKKRKNILATIPDSLLVLDKDLKIKNANLSFYKVFPVEPEAVIGCCITDILGDKDGIFSTELTKLFGTKTEIRNLELCHHSEKLGNRIFNIAAKGISVASEGGEEEEEEVLLVIEDITERKEALERLHSAHQTLETTFDAIQENVNVVDLDFNLLAVNDVLIRRFGLLDKESVLGRKCFEVLKGRKDICPNCAIAEAYRTKAPAYRTSTPEDEVATGSGSFEIFAYPIMDEYGNLSGAVEFARDITERKRTEEQIKASLKEKELLLREIHHRVKNNLQLISSMLMLQSDFIKDKPNIELFNESLNRIKAMALIHDRLYRSEDLASIDFEEYVRDHVNSLFSLYEQDMNKIALEIDVKDVMFGIDTAIPCGLIVNELVSNSLKHAFPEGKGGKIEITIRTTDENEIVLVVSDNGVGIPADWDFRNTESLGLYLVSILAEDQLHGKIELDRTKGTKFQITFSEEVR